MGQMFHMDSWPLLTSTEVTLRVTYQYKEEPTYSMVHNMKWYHTTFTHTFKQSRKICKLEQMSLNTRLKNVHGRGSFDV